MPTTSLLLLQAALTLRAAATSSEDNYERIEFLVMRLSSTQPPLTSSVAIHNIQPSNSSHPRNRRLQPHPSRLGQRPPQLPAIQAVPFQLGRISLAGVASMDSGQLSAGGSKEGGALAGTASVRARHRQRRVHTNTTQSTRCHPTTHLVLLHQLPATPRARPILHIP